MRRNFPTSLLFFMIVWRSAEEVLQNGGASEEVMFFGMAVREGVCRN